MPRGPGSRTLVVSPAESRLSLAAYLRKHLTLSWSQVRRLITDGRVRINGIPCDNPNRHLKAGQRVQFQNQPMRQATPAPARAEAHKTRDKAQQPVIRFADAHVVVVDKPAGLTTMRHPEEAAEFGARARRYLPPTLADLLPELVPGSSPRSIRAVHRLDKETSGLVVFARTPQAEGHLGRQFRAHSTDRRYIAVVAGRAKARRIESDLVRDRGDGRRGSTAQPGEGQRAVTHVRILEELGDYTLVECRLETGRTHQVRIHLGESGTPLCGERVYDRPLHGKPVADHSGAPRLALHAARLGFAHPASGEILSWESPLPKDLAAFVARLRKSRDDRMQKGQGE